MDTCKAAAKGASAAVVAADNDLPTVVGAAGSNLPTAVLACRAAGKWHSSSDATSGNANALGSAVSIAAVPVKEALGF